MPPHGPPFCLLVVSALAVASAASPDIHKSMNRQELQRIFEVDTADEVPPYEVVELHSRVRRSAGGPDGQAGLDGQASEHRTVTFSTRDGTRTLHLTPTPNLARKVPLYFADLDESSTVVVKPAPLQPDDRDVGQPYQDEAAMAAVLVKSDPISGRAMFDGTLGDDLVLRSIPTSVNDKLNSPAPRPPLEDQQPWRREEENDLNAIRTAAKTRADQRGGERGGDLVFSDGFPEVMDDDRSDDTEEPYDSRARNVQYNGTLPEGLELLRKKRSEDSVVDHAVRHIVYRRAVSAIDSDYSLLSPEDLKDHLSTASSGASKSRAKRDAPDTIYPEILVLVDYDGYLLHGQDNTKIKSYYVSFWNGADLRYKLLDSPKVKISIAGIIISRSRDAMPYLERNRVGRDAIDSAAALTDMGKYLFQERRLPTYDIAVAITKYDLCRRRKSGRCTTGTAGFAYVGGACVVNKSLKKVNSVAIVEDTGGFSGIIVAAHEVGHLLGAVHDGSPPPSYLKGPGARRCRWEDGFIMSDLRHTAKGFQWSDCSVEQFHHFLNGDTATCLYNLPHEDESLTRVLPGKLLSLDQQCRKDRGTTACFKDDRVCSQLFCYDSSTGFCVSYRPAAEGSECGDGKICLNGRCVYDNENYIHDDDVYGRR